MRTLPLLGIDLDYGTAVVAVENLLAAVLALLGLLGIGAGAGMKARERNPDASA